MKYLYLWLGLWCLYQAWRGIVSAGGAKSEVGKPMRETTRFIFGLGGVLMTGLGLLLLWRHH
jgi:threonine/homoserine/homoserine lactone efflux protein